MGDRRRASGYVQVPFGNEPLHTKFRRVFVLCTQQGYGLRLYDRACWRLLRNFWIDMHVDNRIRNLKCFGPKKICIPRLSTIFLEALPDRFHAAKQIAVYSGSRSVTKFGSKLHPPELSNSPMLCMPTLLEKIRCSDGTELQGPLESIRKTRILSEAAEQAILA